jgi:U3 small nucleolar RNA-associated protein 21
VFLWRGKLVENFGFSLKMGIFEPFRAIGYITSGVPFSVQRLGTETFVTVSVGKAFQVYNCAKLTLVLASPQLPHKIRALASYRDFTFVAFGNHIAVFKRAHQVSLAWSLNFKRA